MGTRPVIRDINISNNKIYWGAFGINVLHAIFRLLIYTNKVVSNDATNKIDAKQKPHDCETEWISDTDKS